MKKLLCILLIITMLVGFALPVFAEDEGKVSIYYIDRDAVDSVIYYDFNDADNSKWFAFSVGITDIIKYDYVYIQIDYDKKMFEFRDVAFPDEAGAQITSGDTDTGIFVKSEFDDSLRDWPSYQDYYSSTQVEFDVKKPGMVNFNVTAYGIDLGGNKIELDVEFNDVITEVKAKNDASGCQQGDVNCDGEITAADARRALRIAAKLESPEESITKLADIDGNGKVTAGDARTILRIAAGLE